MYHNGISVPYPDTGRTNQKARTRASLVDAARTLIAQAIDPTVERVAEEAQISRSTAYRYFPNQRALLAAAYPVTEATSLLGADPPSDPEERLELVIRELCNQILSSELELRLMWRLSLEEAPQKPEKLLLRRGRAIGWIEDALEPVREQLGELSVRKLALAIRATVGIEALSWLVDIAGLTREEAIELMRWSALGLLRSALAES
jgi:AcrR family transcriptional regulator